jgi:hypothetical protein
MKPSQRRLEPGGVDGDQWQRQFVDISFTSNDREMKYQGYVLVSLPGPAHTLEFEFKTSALRPAEIDIPLRFSSNASVGLFINDELIKTFEFPASQEPTLLIQHLTMNVTKWTEPRETSRLRLVISYNSQQATTTVLLGDARSELGPGVGQKWIWSYAFQSLLFFALAWSCIVGLAILILAHIQPLGDTFRFYAVLIAVLTWIAGVIGLPDVAKIPLRPMLRRLYSKTRSSSDASSLLRSRRVVWLFSLFLSFVLVSCGVGVVVYCLSIRQYYSSLIHRALEESNKDARDITIRQALSLLPWRKEAQMFFESEAYKQRDAEDMSEFREYIRKFEMDQDVKQAIIKAPDSDHLPFCLTKSRSTAFLSDPVVWYANTIIEGEGFTETPLMNEAISLLTTRKDPVAQIQLRNMKLGQMLANEDVKDSELDNGANELRELLEQNYNSRGTHEYQAACDTLAGYYLRTCDPEAASKNLEKAAEWYKKELSARKHQTSHNGEPLWLRPPDKLVLFYMFGSRWKMTGESATNARCLLDFNACKDPIEETKPCDFESTFDKELASPNADYQKESTWTKGTVRDANLKLSLVIEDSLKKGWRY